MSDNREYKGMNGKQEEHLTERVAQLEIGLKNVGHSIEMLRTDFQQFSHTYGASIAESKKTDWAVFWQAVGVVLVMVSALAGIGLAPLYLGQGYIRDTIASQDKATAEKINSEVNRLDTNLQREMRDRDEINTVLLETWKEHAKMSDARIVELERRFHEHTQLEGHPQAMVLFREFKDSDKEQSDALKEQDMKLQQEMRELISALDTRTQLEMKSISDTIRATIEAESRLTEQKIQTILSRIETRNGQAK